MTGKDSSRKSTVMQFEFPVEDEEPKLEEDTKVGIC
jgi:hypothetical protein